MYLLEADGRPKDALIELVCRHGVVVPAEVSAQDLSTQLQAGWRRKVDHQFQISDQQPADEEDWSLLSELGLTRPMPCPFVLYVGLVPGATMRAVYRRTRFFLGDVDLRTVYFLGGSRLLNAQVESREVLLAPEGLPLQPGWQPPADFPEDVTTRNEFWGMQLMLQQTNLPWESVSCFTPEQPKEGGGVRPPGYLDTLRTLQRENPPPKNKVLAVSVGAPYTLRYQHNTEEVFRPTDGYKVHACGDAAPRDFALAKFLDEAATLLHTELRLWQTKS